MSTKIEFIKGDITKQTDVDAIVNAANTSLLGGGGVDGAIHMAAGPLLLEECKLLNGCAVGDAKLTEGYNLPCEYVIHTVGPRYHNGKYKEEELLKRAYQNSLQVAINNGIRKIAFPAISTGIYRFPIIEATKIAVSTVNAFIKDHENSFDLIRFVLFDDNAYEVYREIISQKTINKYELPEFIGNVIDTFEDFLDEKNIQIDNEEREEDNNCKIYGSDYGDLSNKLYELFKQWNICN